MITIIVIIIDCSKEFGDRRRSGARVEIAFREMTMAMIVLTIILVQAIVMIIVIMIIIVIIHIIMIMHMIITLVIIITIIISIIQVFAR